MTMKELMERVGERRFNLVKAYVKDGIAEIEQITKENVDKLEADIVKDQKLYDIPPFMIKLLSVKILDKSGDTDKYRPIPRIWETNLAEEVDVN